jgi:hypothetical protein
MGWEVIFLTLLLLLWMLWLSRRSSRFQMKGELPPRTFGLQTGEEEEFRQKMQTPDESDDEKMGIHEERDRQNDLRKDEKKERKKKRAS